MSARQSIVGAWKVSVAVPGAGSGLVNLAMISQDGTMLVAFPSPTPAAPGAGHRLEYWTPAFGSWAANDDRGVTMKFVALGADENGAPVGTHTITATVTVEDGGEGWSGPFRIEIAGVDGTVRAAVEGTVTATRIRTDG